MKTRMSISGTLRCAVAALAVGLLLTSCRQVLAVADSSLGREIYNTTVHAASVAAQSRSSSSSSSSAAYSSSSNGGSSSSGSSSGLKSSDAGKATGGSSTSKGRKTVTK